MAQHDVWRPDLILTNGRVLTMDRSDTVVEAVAIKDDRILAVGSTGEIDALAGSGTERLDLHGRTALPGLDQGRLERAAVRRPTVIADGAIAGRRPHRPPQRRVAQPLERVR